MELSTPALALAPVTHWAVEGSRQLPICLLPAPRDEQCSLAGRWATRCSIARVSSRNWPKALPAASESNNADALALNHYLRPRAWPLRFQDPLGPLLPISLGPSPCPLTLLHHALWRSLEPSLRRRDVARPCYHSKQDTLDASRPPQRSLTIRACSPRTIRRASMPFFSSPQALRLRDTQFNTPAFVAMGAQSYDYAGNGFMGVFKKSHSAHPDFANLTLLVFEAVMEVVCVSLPGYIVARMGQFDAENQKFLANLNTQLFTPCLSTSRLRVRAGMY
jgi:hypothetical protein